MGDSLRGKEFEYQGGQYKVLEDRGERLVIAPCEGAGERKIVMREAYASGSKSKPKKGSSKGGDEKPAGGGESNDILAGTVKDIETAAPKIEDVDELRGLLERENTAEKPRSGAVKALEARIEELAEAKE